MMKTAFTPHCGTCCNCGNKINYITSGETAPPFSPGEICICGECLFVGEFDNSLNIVHMSDATKENLLSDPDECIELLTLLISALSGNMKPFKHPQNN